MMLNYVFFDPITGKISSSGTAYNGVEIFRDVPPGEDYLVLDGPIGSIRNKLVIDSVIVDDPSPVADDLVSLRANAIREIEVGVEELHRRFLTSIPAQEEVYKVKEAEARAYLAATAPNPDDFSLVKLDADLAGVPLAVAASVIVQRAEQTRSALRAAEGIRRTANSRLAEATTVAEIETEVGGSLKKLAELNDG